MLLALLVVGCGDDDVVNADTAMPDDGMVVDTSVDTQVPKEAADVRIMSWNVENLFDSKDDPNTFDEGSSGRDIPKESAVQLKLDRIAKVIKSTDADIISLQEVENDDMMAELVKRLDGYEAPMILRGNDPRGIDVAILSKYPVARTISHATDRFEREGESYRMARDALEVFINAKGHSLHLFALHLRSQLGGFPSDQKRIAEAEYVRSLAERHIQSGTPNTIILGDLNDTPDSTVLNELKKVMTDPSETIPANDRWTVRYRSPEQYDYVLVEEALAPKVTNTYIRHGGDVNSTSDHSPIYIDLKLPAE